MVAAPQDEVYKTKDDFFVVVTWIAAYRPDDNTDELLYKYFRAKPEAINPLLSGEVQTFLSCLFATMTQQEIVSQRKQIGEKLNAHFITGASNDFENTYGINVTSVRLVNVRYTPELQRAMEERASIGILTGGMKELAAAGITNTMDQRDTYLLMTGKITQAVDVNKITFDGEIRGLEGNQMFVVGNPTGGGIMRGGRGNTSGQKKQQQQQPKT
jgi:membrane protease subunit (stomatin/prohibitin family)